MWQENNQEIGVEHEVCENAVKMSCVNKELAFPACKN